MAKTLCPDWGKWNTLCMHVHLQCPPEYKVNASGV